jgi:methionine-rich copper-binding protein CopC
MKKLIASALLALATAFVATQAAFAHDDVVSTYPTSGETVEAGLVGIQVDFSEDVMASENNEGFEIQVSDAQGNDQPVGCLSAAGSSVSSTASLAAAGDYTVVWRSVGNDGHPLEGTFKFSISNTSNYEQQSADQIPCAIAYDSEAPLITAEGTDGAKTAEDNSGLVGLAIGAAFIVIGTVTGAIAVQVRQKNEAKKPKKLYED